MNLFGGSALKIFGEPMDYSPFSLWEKVRMRAQSLSFALTPALPRRGREDMGLPNVYSALLSLILIGGFPGRTQAASRAAGIHLEAAAGRVSVLREGKIKSEKARKGMALVSGDLVGCGPKSRAMIMMKNGSLIELEQNSSFKIAEAGPRVFSWKLKFGMILAKVNKLLSDQNFDVQTSNAVIGIRGTEFAVEVSSGGQGKTRAGVFEEGHVEVKSKTGQGVALNPDQETSVLPGQAPEPPHALKYFRFAQKRMALLRARQKYFLNLFLKKYGIKPGQ